MTRATEELVYRNWLNRLSRQLGYYLNPDDPDYDYRSFYSDWRQGKTSGGIDPESGEWHFPSTYKNVTHPTYKEGMKFRYMFEPSTKEELRRRF